MKNAWEIILIGGGGHCKSVIDVIEEQGLYKIAGILDVKENVGKSILGYPVIGTDLDIDRLVDGCLNFHITIGHIKSNSIRKQVFDHIKLKKGNLPTIISPRAYVSKYASIGEGSTILHHALISANVRIGLNSIINSRVVIEHDTIVGNHCHIAPGSVINGECVIEDDCFVGSQAIVTQCVRIQAASLIAAGAVVNKSVSSRSLMAGNPAIKKKNL